MRKITPVPGNTPVQISAKKPNSRMVVNTQLTAIMELVIFAGVVLFIYFFIS